jgi:hypothetical protein
MAASINASTSAGLVQSADTTGNLNIQSNGSTVIAVTSAGAAVTGTLSASGNATFSGYLYDAAGTIYTGLGAGAVAIIDNTYSATGVIFKLNAATPSSVFRLGASGQFIVENENKTNIIRAYSGGTVNFDDVIGYGIRSSTMGYANYNGAGTNPSGAVSNWSLRADSVTGRSIGAGGTINASGADYAEYMTKCNDFTLIKGDICGVNANGELTNAFADSVSFVVKSTNPSYVGGDTWGNESAVGEPPKKTDEESDEQFAQRKSVFDGALEVARQRVDRIAFAGQVPVNVTGATPGQYIIPVNDRGLIKGQAVSNPTFEQYQVAVGKVIAIEVDGRAKIIVKVV